MTGRTHHGNFNVYGHYTYYVPAVADMFILLLLLLAGTVIGTIVAMPFPLLFGTDAGTEYSMLVSYPLMFIPAMIYSSSKSRSRCMTHTGAMLDSNHFSPVGGIVCALLVIVGTLAMGFVSDALGSLLPDMPEWLEDVLSRMTGGSVWADFICVSLFAPFFEEWLCRGMILRGLLSNGMKPVWAIFVSALFFAVIHANPWQAVPAFLLGCLFGYVYYKTGSLKLTMLMHFTNNTFALVMSNIDSLKEIDGWHDVFQGPSYFIMLAACAIIVALVCIAFSRIPLQDAKGNSDKAEPLFNS